MLVEIDPAVYDVEGRPVASVRRRHRLALPDVPFGRFLSQPVATKCSSLDEIRAFLRTCRYVSDRRQYGKDDYWCPPEQFDRSRKGDCEDFSLWTWRQLIGLGYECRFVAGSAGFYGTGHAWLTLKIDGCHYLLEPQARRYRKLPRLAVAGYDPVFSVEWRDGKVRFYEHERTKRPEDLATYITLGPEWLLYRSLRLGRLLGLVVSLPVRILWRVLKRIRRY